MPYTVDPGDQYVNEFLKTIEEVCEVKPSIGYMQSIGDFNYLGSRLNAPVVIFGADGKQMHSCDEYASIDSIVKATETIYGFFS